MKACSTIKMIMTGRVASAVPAMVTGHGVDMPSLKGIYPQVTRTLALVYKNKKVLPIASRYFIDYILDYLKV